MAVMVPNYDIHGCQDRRKPYRDLSGLVTEDVRHPRWLAPAPAIKTRSELQQARKAARVPDPRSYDFDGDGHVGQLDYFVGRMFDRDCDGKLSDSERGQAIKAVEAGLLDRYRRITQGSTEREEVLQQKLGNVTSSWDPKANSAYGPHFNSHRVPKHTTKTALLLDRTAELKNKAAAIGDTFVQSQAFVREPQVPTAETKPRTCAYNSVRERAEADHQASRVRAGLLPMSAPVNEREHQSTLNLDYVAEPPVATRSQLNETRKELLKKSAEELRANAAETWVDRDVLKAEKEVAEYDFRRPPPDAKTFTQVKDARRVEKIEHDMRNFGRKSREYPRYSDRTDIPFWSKAAEAAEAPGAPGGAAGSGQESKPSSARAPMSKTTSEPALKVTDVQWEPPEGNVGEGVANGVCTAAGYGPRGSHESSMGSKTVKRWAADCIDRGHGRNKPRLFDGIQPAPVGPRDLESLDLTSSMEPIRNAARHRQAEIRKQNLVSPPQSLLMPVEGPGEAIKVASLKGSLSRRRSTLGGLSSCADLPPRDPGTLLNLQRPRSEQSAVRSSGFQRFNSLEQLSVTQLEASDVAGGGGSRRRTHSESSCAPAW
mmetsp:Transcript_49948/g.139918  ORF Transcript_49948/g.139918 Transcript_49948/m.139918 type:complete len:599 (+) Transcript_49948:82-1878(+)